MIQYDPDFVKSLQEYYYWYDDIIALFNTWCTDHVIGHVRSTAIVWEIQDIKE